MPNAALNAGRHKVGPYVICALLLLPATAQAQWAVGVMGGIHAARTAAPDRTLSGPGGVSISTAKGEAFTIGANLMRAINDRVGVELAGLYSHNSSWQGGGGSPPPKFATLTYFTSLRVVTAAGGAGKVGLSIGGGAAMISHAGTGTSNLARQTDFGLTGAGTLRVRMTRKLSATASVQVFTYKSKYNTGFDSRRDEWIVLGGLRYRL